jgi:drug/metabolite transporter (DMT)-like permease
VSSLLFALPLSAWLAHRKIAKEVRRWALLLVIALAVFVSIGNPNHGADHGSKVGWLIVAAVLGPMVAASLVAAGRAHGTRRASLLAVATGLLGGVLAVFTKAVVGELSHHGVGRVFTSWEIYGLIAVGVSGIYLQQLSFQAGALQASWPIITVLEPIVAAGLGLGLLHEKLRVTHVHLVILILTVIAMVVATAALSRRAALDAPAPDGMPHGHPNPPDPRVERS